MPAFHPPPGRSAEEMRAEIEAFLAWSRRPALFEPGEELLPLDAGNFAIEHRAGRLTLQAWDRTRNLTRRITGVKPPAGARLEMAVERFARRQGQLFLVDLARPAGAELGRRSGRLVFRERFRLFLGRQFPEWKLAELSSEPNLEFSLSPAFPRAFLRSGAHGWAAIACPPDGDAAAVLSFGLIWLAYLRGRERRVTIEGLAVYVPAGQERVAALRLLCLDPASARFELFAYSGEDYVFSIDPRDYGNLDTHLEPCRPDRGAPSLPAGEPSAPEAWLESKVRADIETVDASLLRDPVYGQVPAFAGLNHGIIDLLAIDRRGRLAILELKASADLHLPLQALDYWIRVKWHLDRGEFPAAGYFPGLNLRPEPPRLLLVCPALEFHPTVETLLSFFSPSIEMERIGVGAGWREDLRIMFRLQGAERPR